jgi:hypothetical protein
MDCGAYGHASMLYVTYYYHGVPDSSPGDPCAWSGHPAAGAANSFHLAPSNFLLQNVNRISKADFIANSGIARI